jgi:hypothetical protein
MLGKLQMEELDEVMNSFVDPPTGQREARVN